ncbi:hypothetical protein H6G80_35425 [Nostoc sp. FACHB-87]|uniref:hypothetical protein n=1 Tax=Nostocaceae TaxID=1162 RepID=UPI00168A2D9C|nr:MULTISPECIES: hypothetical protein [Nostocaceae]MBD2459308.1 hypothetical protein [Nostoc sp. FACHB-87]MBD2480321.1 hypothetical protein [Anabaena sp. FACHB-83]
MIHNTQTRLVSLLKQTAYVGLGFLVMLLIVGGHPSGFILGLSVVLGISFVVWYENKISRK